MTLHYIIFGFITLCAVFDNVKVKHNQRVIMFLSCYIVMVLFAGLRYFPEQQDFGEYYNTFAEVANYGKVKTNEYFEPGYVLLMHIVSLFSNSSALFLFVVATVGVGLNYAGIKRFFSDKYIFLSILFYFVHTFIMREMGAVRAGIASGICLYWGLRYVEQRNFLKYTISIIVAMCFHLSAIAFFLVYPIYKMNWRSRTLFIVILICAVIGTIAPLGKVLASMTFLESFSRVAGYAKDISTPLGVWTNPNTLKQLLFSIAGIFFYKDIIRTIPNFRLFLVPYVLSVCWLMIWNDFPIIAGRFAMYFSITEVILIPCLLFVFAKSSRSIVMLILIALAFAILYLNGITFLTPESGYYPYKTIFS